MTNEEAILLLNKMTTINHDKEVLDSCVRKLKNKPNILVGYSSLLALYGIKVYPEAINNILNYNFKLDLDKVSQLEILSSCSFSRSTPAAYLPIILPNNRSIVFEISVDDYDSYSMLIDHLPNNYHCVIKDINKSRRVVAIYYK